MKIHDKNEQNTSTGVDARTSGEDINYQDPNQRQLLDVLTIKAKWYDRASWALLKIGGPIWIGLINSYNYNR